MMGRAIERLRASSANYYSHRSLYSEPEDFGGGAGDSVNQPRASSAPRLHQQQVGPPMHLQ